MGNTFGAPVEKKKNLFDEDESGWQKFLNLGKGVSTVTNALMHDTVDDYGALAGNAMTLGSGLLGQTAGALGGLATMNGPERDESGAYIPGTEREGAYVAASIEAGGEKMMFMPNESDPLYEKQMNNLQTVGTAMEGLSEKLLPLREGFEKYAKQLGIPVAVAAGVWASLAAGAEVINPTHIPGVSKLANMFKKQIGAAAYHGTPFSRYDKIPKGGKTDNILDIFHPDNAFSGEGAQAYGYTPVGYFAEDAGVAGSYRDVLSGKQRWDIDGRQIFADSSDFVDQTAANALDDFGEVDDAVAFLRDGGGPEDLKAADMLEGAGSVKMSDIGQGHLLEVEFDDKAIARMLDWDAPLSEQPFIIKEPKEQIIARVRAEGRKPTIAEGVSVNLQSGSFNDKSGQVFYKDLAHKLGSEEAASRALNEAGIPGIKFYDGNSRNQLRQVPISAARRKEVVSRMQELQKRGTQSADEMNELNALGDELTRADVDKGTRNIVPFNPDDITQVKRDGEIIFENKLGIGAATKTDVADNALAGRRLKK